MKTFCLLMILALLILSACSTTKNYQGFVDWDSSKNGQIERQEFVGAYRAKGYFEKWGKGQSSITYQDLSNSAFESLDADRDGKLSIIEFNSQIKPLYFGIFSESFERWDDNTDASISQKEFHTHVSATNLGSIWDTDDDGRITQGEMAGGMFYVCDTNSNGSVDEVELQTWKRNR